jgi:hypothetical protein
MPPRSRPARSVLPVLAACLTLGIAGCGSDDIAFNGGIFDAVGLSDAGKAKTGDPKMAERAPLVVPPSLDRLPPPGEAAPSSQIADIKDPDEEKKLSQAELQAKQDEYCKKNYDDPKARGDESVESVEGPLGPCRRSVLTAIKNYNKSDDDAQ